MWLFRFHSQDGRCSTDGNYCDADPVSNTEYNSSA